MLTLTKLDRAIQDQIILKPFHHVYKVPSKYHKGVLQVFNHWLKAPEEKVNRVGEILRISHTISLIVDDIQDNAVLRYGLPSAHSVHGIGLTVNSVTQALGIALKKVMELDNSKAIHIFLNALEDGHRGQGIEVYWRDNFVCPTEEEYFDMLKQKSSCMFVLLIQLLQLFSDSEEDYLEIGTLIGVYYSVRDDYCNLFNRERLKGLAENPIEENIHADSDITEGKFTLPIIHALQNPDVAEEIINILKQRTTNLELINHCISILKTEGSDKYTEKVLLRLENDIYKEITRLGSNPKLISMIDELRNWRNRHEEQLQNINYNKI